MFYKIDFAGCNMIAMCVIKLYHRVCRDELWHLDHSDVGHHNKKYILVYSRHILKTTIGCFEIPIQDVGFEQLYYGNREMHTIGSKDFFSK